MSGLGRLLGIGSLDDNFIEGLLDDLDDLDTLKIKYSLKDITLDLGTLTGIDIIQWLVCKIARAFQSDFEQYVEDIGGTVSLYDFVVDVVGIEGDCWIELRYRETSIDESFISEYISGDRDTVFAELLEKCGEIDEIY